MSGGTRSLPSAERDVIPPYTSEEDDRIRESTSKHTWDGVERGCRDHSPFVRQFSPTWFNGSCSVIVSPFIDLSTLTGIESVLDQNTGMIACRRRRGNEKRPPASTSGVRVPNIDDGST